MSDTWLESPYVDQLADEPEADDQAFEATLNDAYIAGVRIDYQEGF